MYSSDDLIHGGNIAALSKHFLNATLPWIDLSTGINPWPYPLGPIPNELLTRLPDSGAQTACVEAMAAAWGAPSDHVLATPGSAIAIALLPLIVNATKVSIVSPTYGDHAFTWKKVGAQVCQVPNLDEATGEVIVVVNPNNPDGRFWSQANLLEVAHRQALIGGWLIVDEAYCDLRPELSCARFAGTPGLIVLRSFGKFYGLAGVRLGALLAPQPILLALGEMMGPWPVSGPALWAGAQALCDAHWKEMTRDRLKTASRQLCLTLEACGLRIDGREALFVYVWVNDAHALWSHLAAHGIATRRFEWAINHLRVGLTADGEALGRLTRALSCAPEGSIKA